MGWHREVAGMIEKYGSFRLESHDAERMIESDELEVENTALRTALSASTDMLRRLRRHYGRDFTDLDDCDIRSVIVANEAALMRGGE